MAELRLAAGSSKLLEKDGGGAEAPIIVGHAAVGWYSVPPSAHDQSCHGVCRESLAETLGMALVHNVL